MSIFGALSSLFPSWVSEWWERMVEDLREEVQDHGLAWPRGLFTGIFDHIGSGDEASSTIQPPARSAATAVADDADGPNAFASTEDDGSDNSGGSPAGLLDRYRTAADGSNGAEVVAREGTAGTDTFRGGPWADHFVGLGGSDFFKGGFGADFLEGGDDGDTLLGGPGGDRLDGGAGADRLYGGWGRDTLTGGLGADFLSGGAGRDVFDFNSVAESPAGAGYDTIDHFDRTPHRGDLIDLRDIDAQTTVEGDQAFTWIGDGAFTKTAGELRYAASGDGVLVSGDVNGDGNADFQVLVHNIAALSASDFLL